MKIMRLLEAGHEMKVIEISGNDPLEYPGLVDVILWLRSVSPASRIVLSTHGKGLHSRLSDLVQAGISSFVIPLYGHDAKVHDAVTRVPGSFDETIDSLQSLAEGGLLFHLTTLITPHNLRYLPQLFTFMASKASGFSVGVPLFAPDREVDFALNVSELQPHLDRALLKLRSLSPAQVRLRNIPRCVVKYHENAVFEVSRPPRYGYEHRKYVPGSYRLLPTDHGVIPNYLSMVKGEECSRCIHDADCAGFYESYVVKGLFSFRAIKKAVRGN